MFACAMNEVCCKRDLLKLLSFLTISRSDSVIFSKSSSRRTSVCNSLYPPVGSPCLNWSEWFMRTSVSPLRPSARPLLWCLNATLVPWLLNFPGYKKVIEVISNRVCGNKQRAPLRHKLRGPQVILNPRRCSLRCRPGWGQVLNYCCTVTTRLQHNERAWARELKRLVCNEHRAPLQRDTWLRWRTDCTRLLPLQNLVLSHQDLDVKWFSAICLNKHGRIPLPEMVLLQRIMSSHWNKSHRDPSYCYQ